MAILIHCHFHSLHSNTVKRERDSFPHPLSLSSFGISYMFKTTFYITKQQRVTISFIWNQFLFHFVVETAAAANKVDNLIMSSIIIIILSVTGAIFQ